jgi:outer membrane usher protein FimD/PapC
MTLRNCYAAQAIARALRCPKYGFTVILPAALSAIPYTACADNYFNPAFLVGDNSAVADLSRFENSNGQVPGKYRVDIYINQQFISSEDVDFKADKKSQDDTGLSPCFTLTRLEAMGLNPNAFPALKALPADQCVPFDAIPDGSTRFDFEHQKLDISIPQAGMKQSARGYIPP